MGSSSYTNLLELAFGEPSSLARLRREISRLVTVPGIIPDIESSDKFDSEFNSPFSSVPQDRTIIVANHLPIRAHCSSPKSILSSDDGWRLSWDDDALLLQLKDSISSSHANNMDFVSSAASVMSEISVSDQELVSQTLLESFNCVPVFMHHDLSSRYYHGFCKNHLWSLFRSLLSLSTLVYLL